MRARRLRLDTARRAAKSPTTARALSMMCSPRRRMGSAFRASPASRSGIFPSSGRCRSARWPSSTSMRTVSPFFHHIPEHRFHGERMAPKTATDLINDAKTRIREVSPKEAREMRARGDTAVYLDVREPNEWNLGHLPGAMHIPRGLLESKIEAAVPRDRKVVIYCASGNRSALAADTLQQMGYADVVSMSGGFTAWAQSGGEVEG